ncbi:MAG: hypothetical protein AB2556_17140 [Candidatus Thiodiazotropha sp.]
MRLTIWPRRGFLGRRGRRGRPGGRRGRPGRRELPKTMQADLDMGGFRIKNLKPQLWDHQ